MGFWKRLLNILVGIYDQQFQGDCYFNGLWLTGSMQSFGFFNTFSGWPALNSQWMQLTKWFVKISMSPSNKLFLEPLLLAYLDLLGKMIINCEIFCKKGEHSSFGKSLQRQRLWSAYQAIVNRWSFLCCDIAISKWLTRFFSNSHLHLLYESISGLSTGIQNSIQMIHPMTKA